MSSYDSFAFSTSTLTVAPQDTSLQLSSTDSVQIPSNMDTFESSLELNFVSEDFLDDLHGENLSLGFTPTYDLEPFGTTFDDPFSYQSGFLDATAPNDASSTKGAEASSDDLENKLLSFSAPLPKLTVFELNGSQSWLALKAELNGMFFVAEDVFESEAGDRPMELTCYRRNLFQISGTVMLSRSISEVMTEQGLQIPIFELQATLSAVESIDGKPAEIITVPWKSNAAARSDDKAGSAPQKWLLDLSMNPELDPTNVSIPIAWKRLQFKHATANNGRRKGLQQNYTMQINIMATLATGEVVKITEIQSSPIIVRGRNPGNFGGGREVSLNEKKAEPKQRTLSTPEPPVQVDQGLPRSNSRQHAADAVQPLDLSEWDTPASTSVETPNRRAKRPTLTSKSLSASTSNPEHRPSEPKSQHSASSINPTSLRNSILDGTLPLDLSLSDDLNPSITRAQPQPLHVNEIQTSSNAPENPHIHPLITESKLDTKLILPAAKIPRKTPGTLDLPTADLLYEYFPLSIDDWMPPVDAIYRPHVVHHTPAIPIVNGGQMLGGRRKMKRYFSAGEDD